MANHSCTAKLAQKIIRRITRSLSRLDGLLLQLLRAVAFKICWNFLELTFTCKWKQVRPPGVCGKPARQNTASSTEVPIQEYIQYVDLQNKFSLKSQSVLDFEGEKRGHKISLEILENQDVDSSNYNGHQENRRGGLAFICLDTQQAPEVHTVEYCNWDRKRLAQRLLGAQEGLYFIVLLLLSDKHNYSYMHLAYYPQ